MHRVLIVGAGSIGERHLRCFLSTGRVRAEFVETREDLRETLAGRYGVPGHANLAEALQGELDAVVIATPAPLHVPQAIECVRTGRHLLVEKPLSTSSHGLVELREAVEARGVVAGVAYVYRCYPVFQRLRDAVNGGQFGRPVQWTAVCGQHFPTYRPAYRSIYYADREAGGGAIQDALTHVLNAGEWILGPIDRLVADSAHQVLPDVSVEDTVHVLARHGSVMASYSLNQHQAPNEMLITVACENGTVRVELPRNRLLWMTDPGGEWTVEDLGPIERDSVFIHQANRFLDAIEGRSPVPCPLSEGIQTLRVNLAALSSVESQTWSHVTS